VIAVWPLAPSRATARTSGSPSLSVVNHLPGAIIQLIIIDGYRNGGGRRQMDV
jgi:hypothetical protein